MTELQIKRSPAPKLTAEERFEMARRDVLRRIRLRPARDGRSGRGAQ